MERNKVEIFARISDELRELYRAKNHDYGDSFGESYAEWGLVSPCIRLSDKVNRLKSLTQKNRAVTDESVEDTLVDLACYAIMTLVELRLDGDIDSESHGGIDPVSHSSDEIVIGNSEVEVMDNGDGTVTMRWSDVCES